MLHIIIIIHGEMIHLFSRPHRSYYDHHLVRSPRRESTILWYQYDNIMFTARTQARGGLGRASFCQLESVFLRPHHRSRRHRRDGVRQSFVLYAYVLLCTSGSDLELDEHGWWYIYIYIYIRIHRYNYLNTTRKIYHHNLLFDLSSFRRSCTAMNYTV